MRDRNDLVIIQLDKPRELVLSHRAMKMMEKLLGVSIENFSLDNLDSENIEKVMFCLLQTDFRNNGETVELEKMEDLLDFARPYGSIPTKIGEAFSAAFPDADPNGNRAATSDGKQVSSSPPRSGSRSRNTIA